MDGRQNIILEINKTDVFENMKLYRDITPQLRERGYKILLDGLSFFNIAAIDFHGIDCDYAKLFWSSELRDLGSDVMANIVGKVKGSERPLWVLARCDTAESLRFARFCGIKMVQGRLADHMVKKNIPL